MELAPVNCELYTCACLYFCYEVIDNTMTGRHMAGGSSWDNVEPSPCGAQPVTAVAGTLLLLSPGALLRLFHGQLMCGAKLCMSGSFFPSKGSVSLLLVGR